MIPDDPRLTAHALGEGEGALSPEERAEVEALRATADALRAGLAAEPRPALDPAHREAIEAALAGGAAPAPVLRLPARAGIGVLAASLLLVVGFAVAGATGVVEFGGRGNAIGVGSEYGGVPNALAVHQDDNQWQVFDPVTLLPIAAGSTGSDSAGFWPHPQGPPAGGGAPYSYTPAASREGGGGGGYVADGDRDYGFGGGGGGGGKQIAGEPRSSTYRAKYGPVGGPAEEMQTNPSGSPRRLLHMKGVGGGGGGAGGNFARSGRGGRGNGPAGEVAARDGSDEGGSGAGSGPGEVVLYSGAEVPPVLPNLRVPMAGTLPASVLTLHDVKDVTNGVTDFPAEDALSTADHDPTVENAWIRPIGEAALSTFSIDVDTASYAIVRRCLLEQNRLPPKGAARLEEMVNYFRYDYPQPAGSDPVTVHVDAASCPWEPRHRLVRVALKAREVEEAARPPANLVLLLDVSGSMDQPNKLPLVQQSVAMLADRLTANDRLAVVVYAGASGLVLPSTPGDRKETIRKAIDDLRSGGSTNGGAGISLAYKVAEENFLPGGINRVVLATDGDFNVGVTNRSDLVDLVKEKAKSKVFLTALGYGMDNLKDATLEALADRGNGNYGYVDGLAEARKVLVEEGMSTLHVVAKDVKFQVEFNPSEVAAYRLVGYENRLLAAQDFADDAKDAGEVGAGHGVTAFYEVVPAGEPVPGAPVDALKYQRAGEGDGSPETLTVKLRWKAPEGDISTAREFPFRDAGLAFDAAPPDFRFAAAVAEFALVLRGSEHRGSGNFASVREIAAGALGDDPGGYRAGFLALVDRAASLSRPAADAK